MQAYKYNDDILFLLAGLLIQEENEFKYTFYLAGELNTLYENLDIREYNYFCTYVYTHPQVQPNVLNHII